MFGKVRALAVAVVETSPDWLRHAAVLFVASSAGVVLKAVVAAQGVTGVAWPETLRAALDTGASATAAGLLLLTATPATRRYGVGARDGRHEA
jgi:DNA-binding transcriptional regulator LsrR (DeoR family)